MLGQPADHGLVTTERDKTTGAYFKHYYDFCQLLMMSAKHIKYAVFCAIILSSTHLHGACFSLLVSQCSGINTFLKHAFKCGFCLVIITVNNLSVRSTTSRCHNVVLIFGHHLRGCDASELFCVSINIIFRAIFQ